MKKVLVIGSSGHAKVVIDILEKQNCFEIAGILDDNQPSDAITALYSYTGTISSITAAMATECLFAIGIGENSLRQKMIIQIKSKHPEIKFVNAIHPNAVIGKQVSLEEGTVVMAGAVINPFTHIGSFCVINTNASIDHDSHMNDFSSLAPGATTGGNVTIGEGSHVAIGATIAHGITIGDNTVVGAGSTVIDNIPSHVLTHGTPAKVIRERSLGEKTF